MKKASNENDKQYCAFLRGINVGGHTVINMEELRKAFASLGLRKVKTVLASGNVLFEAPREDPAVLSRDISQGLMKAFGRDIVVIVRPVDGLLELEARQPFKAVKVTPQTRLFVTFLSDTTGQGDISSPSVRDGFQILSVSSGAICSVLDERPGVGAVHLMGVIEKEYGPNITTRTWGTIMKILKAGDS